MVEAVPVQGNFIRGRKTLNRFSVWENKLEVDDKQIPKIKEQKMKISRTEFKNEKTPLEKVFDSRVMLREQYVTKGYLERRKKNPIFDAFGVTEENDKPYHNAQATMVHRENVWHPYYEIKVEEEDLGTIFRNRQQEKNASNVEGAKVSSLEQRIENMDKQHRDQKDQMQNEASGAQASQKKGLFDAKAIQEKKRAEEEANANKQVVDPKGIKVQQLPADVEQSELEQLFQDKFGKITRCWVPYDGDRSRGFAIINFEKEESVKKALEVGEVTYGFNTLMIVPAMQSAGRLAMRNRMERGDRDRPYDRDRGDRPYDRDRGDRPYGGGRGGRDRDRDRGQGGDF